MGEEKERVEMMLKREDGRVSEMLSVLVEQQTGHKQREAGSKFTLTLIFYVRNSKQSDLHYTRQ